MMKQFLSETIIRFITSSLIGTSFWCVFFYLPEAAFSVLLFTILCTILVLEWKNLFRLSDIAFWLIMPWYPIMPFAIMIYMSSMPCYRTLIYYLFVIVFAFDSSAYITGKLIGVRKIIPSISPGKTVEGCIGGLFGALITFYMSTYYQKISVSFGVMFALVFIVCAMAFVGDIFESYLKRKAGIKDSGHILPGHGGFLDRFDAVMMASFFFFLFKDELSFILCTTV